MYETDHDTIKKIFYKQISDLTRKTVGNSFDYQFSDRWTPHL